MKNVIVLAMVVAAMSGCGVSVGYDYAQFGTENGINANGDQLNALITNGKASADKKSAAHALREYQEAERTKRALSGGLFSGLFSKNEVQK